MDLRARDLDDEMAATARELVWALALELPGRPWAVYDRHGRAIAASEHGTPSGGADDGIAEVGLGREGHVLVVAAGRGLDRSGLEGTAARVGARMFSVVLSSKRALREAEASAAWAWAVAHQDPVTRVLNGRGWWHELGARTWGAPDASSVVVARVQLLNLRELNDEFGHTRGDEILLVVAERLVDRLSAGDLVARLGGGDFAVLAHATDEPSLAAIVAAAIEIPLTTFRSSTATHDPDDPIRVTVARADLALRS